jgi:SNF2 family DNA or RNA helicase
MQDWEDEGERWVTGEKTFVQIRGTRVQKEVLLKKPGRFVIINYESTRAPELKNGKRADLPGLWRCNFDIVVFDEAHRLKNKRAKRTGGAIKLVSQAHRAVFLTGTPMVNAPQELFPILHMTDPLRFSSYWTFVDRFCQMEENPFANTPKITGVKNLDHLQFILAGVMVRREKKDVLPELPDKMYKNIRVELEPAQKKLYKQLKKDMMAEFENGNSIVTVNVVSLMIRLRQICCSPLLIGAGFADSAKTDAFFDIVDEFVETNEKLIVFSFFKSYLKLLSDELTAKNIDHVLTTGETPQVMREFNKKQFEHDPTCNIFMITTSTGGEGLNLQYASNVLFLDKPWTPAEMHQAEDRVHRMGQTKSPLIMSITCKGTIEEYINKVIDTKDGMITQTMAMERVIAALVAEED